MHIHDHFHAHLRLQTQTVPRNPSRSSRRIREASAWSGSDCTRSKPGGRNCATLTPQSAKTRSARTATQTKENAKASTKPKTPGTRKPPNNKKQQKATKNNQTAETNPPQSGSGGIRTLGQWLKRPSLYLAELRTPAHGPNRPNGFKLFRDLLHPQRIKPRCIISGLEGLLNGQDRGS